MGDTPARERGDPGAKAIVVGYLEAEADRLRDELRDLKRCQLQYASLSVVGTGGIIGIAATLAEHADPNSFGMAFLAPLVIVLPCWLIFFDKATTITRIVGFVRLLESELTNAVGSLDYAGMDLPGYETALERFRAREEEIRHELLREASERRSRDQEKERRAPWRHQYWTVHWLMFCLLSLLCLVLAGTAVPGLSAMSVSVVLLIVSGVLYLFSLGVTAVFLLSLRRGRFSYAVMAAVWARLASREQWSSSRGEDQARTRV